MYGSHKYGTIHKREIVRRKKAGRPFWRLSDGNTYPVTVRKVAVQ